MNTPIQTRTHINNKRLGSTVSEILEVPEAPKKQKLNDSSNLRIRLRIFPRSLTSEFDTEIKAGTQSETQSGTQSGTQVRTQSGTQSESEADIQEIGISSEVRTNDFDFVIEMGFDSGLVYQEQFDGIVRNIKFRFDDFESFTNIYPRTVVSTMVCFPYTPTKNNLENPTEPVCPDAPTKKSKSKSKVSRSKVSGIVKKINF